jgi:hypothetical protein
MKAQQHPWPPWRVNSLTSRMHDMHSYSEFRISHKRHLNQAESGTLALLAPLPIQISPYVTRHDTGWTMRSGVQHHSQSRHFSTLTSAPDPNVCGALHCSMTYLRRHVRLKCSRRYPTPSILLSSDPWCNWRAGTFSIGYNCCPWREQRKRTHHTASGYSEACHALCILSLRSIPSRLCIIWSSCPRGHGKPRMDKTISVAASRTS